MNSHKKLKVALIGAGGWGRQHARIFQAHEGVDFCAVVGRSPDRTMKRAGEFGVRAYTDIAQMLDREQPDLVSLCLPNREHFEPTLQVIRAGVPLLVEKPLVYTLQEADLLLNEASRRGLFFAINFNHRYAKPVELAVKAIEEGKLGEMTLASWRFGGKGVCDHPYTNLIATQCHGLDMLEYLGGPIESVMAEMTDKTGGGFRTLSLSLRFASGAVGSLLGTNDSSYAYPDTHRMELDGTKGRVVIHDTVKRFVYHPAESELGEVWEAGYFNDRDRAFHRTFDTHFDALLQAFRAGERPPVPAEAGYRALLLAEAAIRSFEQGVRVTVNG
ncbi:Myo-inositol 2-dehydrogenase [Paenibacillus solanacearum]|uniref:Myo-inositol 2-dehydrogenase n=1 Tax=Paenibacillus solanacearum TaxID=2048548 RepID=A0A916JVJ3_9BACL|nr:Gfo/Idh/MocA family oxidoreductase [Paenibacillus solanacearum]CAG7607974.1 Myo-inositol 2-dehydrogenase [Paenibacillus solanacearum]